MNESQIWIAQLSSQLDRVKARELEQLGQRIPVARAQLELIHACQRERGLTNLWLGHPHNELEPDWLDQTQATDRAIEQLVQQLQAASDLSSVSLLQRILQWQNEAASITHLRNDIAAGEVNAAEATRVWNHQIHTVTQMLVSVLDLDLPKSQSRLIGALIQLTQLKEYTGHERAWVSFGLAIGRFDQDLRERVLRLREHQRVAMNSAGELDSECVQSTQSLHNLEKLRGVFDRFADDQVPDGLADTWFEVASAWIDELFERQLGLLAQIKSGPVQTPDEPSKDPRETAFRRLALGSVGLSQVLQEQSQHLAEMRVELAKAKRELANRKKIESAKGLLMQYQNLSESQAFNLMRERAMNSGLALEVVAERIIAAVERVSQ